MEGMAQKAQRLEHPSAIFTYTKPLPRVPETVLPTPRRDNFLLGAASLARPAPP